MNSNSRWLGFTALAVVIACIGVCAAIGFGIRFAPDLFLFANSRNNLKVGSVAPDFSLASLDGKSFQLSQFRGQPVLLSFGTSWCPDCRTEAPVLQELHEQHPELVVLLVDSNEDVGTVRGFAREFGMTHPVLLDIDGAVSDRYRIFAIPTGFFIDAGGVIRALRIEGLTPKLLSKNLPLIGVEP